MEFLSVEKLNQINGGGKSLWFILGGFGVFMAGLISGFFNPKACN